MQRGKGQRAAKKLRHARPTQGADDLDGSALQKKRFKRRGNQHNDEECQQRFSEQVQLRFGRTFGEQEPNREGQSDLEGELLN